MKYLRARLSERSTHAGLAALGVSLAMLLFPQHAQTISTVAALAGVGAAALPTGGQSQ